VILLTKFPYFLETPFLFYLIKNLPLVASFRKTNIKKKLKIIFDFILFCLFQNFFSRQNILG
jgi:hypothetical protein